jgi:hypothetical protein
MYADLVGTEQAPHTPHAGCWAGPTFPILLFYFILFLLFCFSVVFFFLRFSKAFSKADSF